MRKQYPTRQAIIEKRVKIATAIMIPVFIVLGLWRWVAPPAQPVTYDPELAQAASQFMQRNFGMPGYAASWYGDIIDIQAKRTKRGQYTLEVLTILAGSDMENGQNICNALSGFWKKYPEVFDGIRVSTGTKLVGKRYSLRTPCR